MPVESFNGYRRNDDYLRDVARGGVVGARPFNGFGRRITAGAESNVLWPNGVYSFPPAAGVQMSIVSTSANDAAAGTGIQSVHVHYLDANLVDQDELVVLNGLTPVLTVATDIRFIQCMHVEAVGSGKVAAGTITASNGGNTYSEIGVGYIRCASSVRMVPAGKRLLVTAAYSGSISGSAAAGTILELASTYFEGHDYISQNIMLPLASAAFQDGSGGTVIPCPAAFYEGQAVGMKFTTDKAATIVGNWFGVLENI